MAKATKTTAPVQPADERIRIRAYEIWEAEGYPVGEDARHWAMAEAEFAVAVEPAKAKAPRKPAARKAKPVVPSADVVALEIPAKSEATTATKGPAEVTPIASKRGSKTA